MKSLLKTVAVTAVLAMGGTAAVAENAFGQQSVAMEGNSLTIDLITTDAPGMVVIYDYSGGALGEAIGMADINEGANADVIVQLSETPRDPRVAALLFVGTDTSDPAMAVARINIDVDN